MQARYLASRGIAREQHDAVAAALDKCLRESAPVMARAFCDAVKAVPVVKARHIPRPVISSKSIERMYAVHFGDDYIGPGGLPRELHLLERERPDLASALGIRVH